MTKRVGREREKKGKTRGELAALRSHPFPKMGYKLAGRFFPIIREIARRAAFLLQVLSWQSAADSVLFNFCYVSRESFVVVSSKCVLTLYLWRAI